MQSVRKMTESQIVQQVSRIRNSMVDREWSPLRKYIGSIVDSGWFSSFILGIIIINTIMIACQTDRQMQMKYGEKP